MNKKQNKIKREILLPPDLITLLDKPKKDPRVSMTYGFFSHFVEEILRSNLVKYYECLYGPEGKKVLEYELERQTNPVADDNQTGFPWT